MKFNHHYEELQQNYLFSEIGARVKKYDGKNKLIRMGIGDVTLPLAPAVVSAMKAACEEMAHADTFRGYGPEQGYDFLREKVAAYYQKKGVTLALNEIFISDGAKSDVANFLDLFAADNEILVTTPVYPVYVDTNIMAGRKVSYLEANEKNGFLPLPSADLKADIIYICSPNNPTGAVYNRAQLKQWVDFASSQGALILFDAAYEAFVSGNDFPSSIYEIDGAKNCAVEFCSLSKTAGFTGTRCGYTIVPIDILQDNLELNHMWQRRQTTKFNGVSYIVQRGAEAVFSDEGQRETRSAIDYYKRNAKYIADVFAKKGVWFTGGVQSPYVWFKIPNGSTSWQYFDHLLHDLGVVGTPGVGFGDAGEGYFRFSSFGSYENTVEAMERIKKDL